MTIETGPGWELRLGRWQDVLADVECDAVITDPPYSERTHSGHRSGVQGTKRVDRRTGAVYSSGKCKRREITYPAWSADDVLDFTAWADAACDGWVAVLTDHVLAPEFESRAQLAGRYAFPPVPAVETGRSVRLTGDGPSSWASWLMVSRPRNREFAAWGTLPGRYEVPGGPRDRHIGGKPLLMMRQIVGDYSRPGDLVCDPCAGGGTTLLAAVMEGRRAIGAECDPETFELAVKRLRQGFTRALPGLEVTPQPKQGGIFE